MFEAILALYLLLAIKWTFYRYFDVKEPIIRPWLKSGLKRLRRGWYRLLNRLHRLFQS